MNKKAIILNIFNRVVCQKDGHHSLMEDTNKKVLSVKQPNAICGLISPQYEVCCRRHRDRTHGVRVLGVGSIWSLGTW